MKLAIMQPYFFPYIGYYQLLHAVDKFVIYDDVNFIKRGWINRNNILINNKPSLFTIPLTGASQNKLIKEVTVTDLEKWSNTFFKTIEQSYKKAPFYNATISILKNVLYSEHQNIADLCYASLVAVVEYLGLTTQIIRSSAIYNNQELKGQARILDICLQENSKVYINPKGGMDLYNKEIFEKEGVKLQFIQSLDVRYKQYTSEFVPWLSMIDVLMFNSPAEIKIMLDKYELI
ncbi:hypothetical protein EFA69_07070 [Rufibacter immobilis]|uniref:Glycine transferase n=1 Tax=Rufibacter immobilis TaxID=1348778 RepID=A0A3M9N1F6_9BACT|nr:WbqC family protein [Rufibacter immobilis]RNI30858.1 hypothetical protein EFA69_07070 [Rufibacter immobilis]